MILRSLPFLVVTLIVFAAMGTAGAQVSPGCQIVGTDGDDVLVGTNGDDIICGLGGNDILQGGAGNDLLLGGAGEDSLFGGSGSDVLRGGAGIDLLVGGSDSDFLRGGNGDDELAGGRGDDILWGGNGADFLRGADGSDVLRGGAGADLIRGGAGSDRLRGGSGGDVCIDSSRRTSALTCEIGNGGDGDSVILNRALWEWFGDDEFVYSMSILVSCVPHDECDERGGFAEVVHVRDGLATSPFDGPAFSAEELFVLASSAISDARTVEFDRAFGLPRLIRMADGTGIALSEVVGRDRLRADLESAQRAWREAALTEYSYTVSTECFCPLTVPIRVRVDGTDVTGVPLEDHAEWTGGVKRIEEHLSDIEAVLDGHAIQVDASFDSEIGVPVRYSVDQNRMIADEERVVSISDFTIPQIVEQPSAEDDPAREIDTVVVDRVDDEHTADDVLPVLEIVAVNGIEVSAAIADDLASLLDAATADGFVLSGGGFRDPQRQIDLRRANCGTTDFAIFEMPPEQCSPPTARPGASQHELGLAIDFTSGGRLITSRTDPAFLWLEGQASTFGFVNLPTEPWHWSTTGN